MLIRASRYLWTVSAAVLGLFLTGSPSLAKDPVTPTEVIRPFDDGNLAQFSTWLKTTQTKDPQKVFRLQDGVLRCGDEDMGYLATKQSYQNYWLTVEYKWGRKNPQDKYVRNSGVLLHGTGPDGSANGVWMTSIECQLAQGCEGDLIVIPGKTAEGKSFPATISSRTRKAEDGKTRWDASGDVTVYSGKQFWWNNHQPFFEELSDTRGKNDVASPLGEWTRVDCLCSENRISIYINGHAVNQAFDVRPAAGKILLQTEGHEVFFRNLQIGPLPASPDDWAAEIGRWRKEKK